MSEQETQREANRIEAEARAIVKEAGAFHQDGHFVLTSGRHAKVFMDFDKLTKAQIALIGGLMADMLIHVVKPKGIPGALVGVMTGGWDLAESLGQNYRIICDSAPAIRASKNGPDEFVLAPQDMVVVRGKRVYIVDDVLTTGKSARATKVAIEAAGGICAGLMVACDRSGKTAEELGFETVWSLFKLAAESCPPEECTQCKEGMPVHQTIGHPEKFQPKVA